jgi:DNA-binding LytR/AlgR family response regulator
MIHIAVCDDSPITSSYVEEYLSKLPLKDISFDVFSSGNDLINYMEKNPDNAYFNIYFMDIEMPGVNGIETAAYIRKNDKNAIIIFITEHKEYVYQVFAVLPFRFIVKPLDKERLDIVLKEAIENIQTMKQLFFFKKERQEFQIPFDEILYFEGAGRKVKLLTETTEYVFYDKISNIKGEVDKNLFLQIHASYLVNMEFIRFISEVEVVLEGNVKLPISKKFRKEAKLQHLNFMEWRCGQ